MSLPLPEILITALLAAGFAAVGEVILRRPSRSAAGANESMLVGMGVCAAALFPLTLILPHDALLAEAILLAACLCWAILRRIARGEGIARTARPPLDPTARGILAAVILVTAVFAALNFRYTYAWDGFMIWATKARLLSHVGSLNREWLLPGDLYGMRHLEYPPAVPLYEALLSLLRGSFDYDKLKPVFLVFYLSVLIGTYAAARTQLPARLAAAAGLLVCLLPAVSTQYATGGYADMPQAAFVAGVVAAGMAGRRDSLPWLIGALTTVKAEGAILAALSCGGIALFWVLESGHNLARQIAASVRGIAVVAAFFLVRFAYVRWVGAPEFVYHGGLAEALTRIPQAVRLCLMQLLDPRRWGLFWPAFGAAAIVLLTRGSNREKAISVTTAVGLALSIVPFLFTTWPLEVHIEQAYFRLAAQLSPAAAVSIVLAYAQLKQALPAQTPLPSSIS